MVLLTPVKDNTVHKFVEDLQKKARYSFSKDEIAKTLKIRPTSLIKGLQRLKQAGRIKMIRRGFYVIIPLEYSINGMIPPDWFVDDLMKFLKRPYYVGVLSASALHGASHQQPQEYHVVIESPKKPVNAQNLRIRFFQKKNLAKTAIQQIKGYTGLLPMSSPSATALDLVRFAPSIGGLDVVLTILTELVDKMTPDDLLKAAKLEPDRCYVQRLGWLLDKIKKCELTKPLQQWLIKQRPIKTPLDVREPKRGFHKDPRWQVIVNASPQSEL